MEPNPRPDPPVFKPGGFKFDINDIKPGSFWDPDSDVMRYVDGLMLRALDISDRLRPHLARHEGHWTAREATKLLAKHSAPGRVDLPPPDIVERVMEQSRRNVRGRSMLRIARLGAAMRSMRQDVFVRACQPAQPELKPQFEKALRRKGPRNGP